MSDRVPLTVADLQELLSYIPADDRDTWVAVAMGVKSEFGEAAFDAWDAWSQGEKSYNAKAARDVWKSCRKGGTGMGTVIKLAKDNGWAPRREPMTAEEKRRLNAEAEARRPDCYFLLAWNYLSAILEKEKKYWLSKMTRTSQILSNSCSKRKILK